MNNSIIVSASAMSDHVAIQSGQIHVRENITCLNATHFFIDHKTTHGHTEVSLNSLNLA